MVRIRLRRVGAKKQPYYRVVVADQRSPRDGRHIETIGHYDPRTEPETVNIKEDRALYWLSVGAQPTDAVRKFLDKQGTLGRLTRLKAGEPLEALVAEYESSTATAEAIESAEESTDASAETAEVEAAVEVEAQDVEPEAQAPELEEEEADVPAEPEDSAETEAPADEG